MTAPPRVLLVGDIGGLDTKLEPDIAVDRADSVRLALAYAALRAHRVFAVTQSVRGRGDPRAGEWLLAWFRSHYPNARRVLVIDPWTSDPLAFEASGLAHVAVEAGMPLAELTHTIRALVYGHPITHYRLGHRPPERPWRRTRPGG